MTSSDLTRATVAAFSDLSARLILAIEQKARRRPSTKNTSTRLFGTMESQLSRQRKKGRERIKPHVPRKKVMVRKLASLIDLVTTNLRERAKRAPSAKPEPVNVFVSKDSFPVRRGGFIIKKIPPKVRNAINMGSRAHFSLRMK